MSALLLPERIETFISTLQKADNLDKIFDAIVQRVKELGFDQFAYWMIYPPEGPQRQICITNYPNDWAEYYLDENLGSDDFVGRYSAISNTPFLWNDIISATSLTKRQQMVFCEGATAGLRAGGTVPIHGPLAAKATFSVANDMNDEEFAKLFRARRHEVHLIATYAHEKIIGLGLSKNIAVSTHLTPREIEILTWLAKGKSRWEVGIILEMAESTVKTHLENIRSKLDASNTTHAIAKAIMNGLVIPWCAPPIQNN